MSPRLPTYGWLLLALGALLIAAGAAWALLTRDPLQPWFAPVILGIVAVFAAGTARDAEANDIDEPDTPPHDRA